MGYKRFKKIHEIDPDILAKKSQYIAGLMDGEGAFMSKFNARTKIPRFQPLLVLGMDDGKTIEFVANVFGVTYETRLRRRKKRSGDREKVITKKTYRLFVFEEDAVKKVLTALLPALITKKKQAKLILELIRMKKDFPGTKEALRDLLIKQAEIHSEVGRLHTKGPSFDENKFRKQFDEAIRKI